VCTTYRVGTDRIGVDDDDDDNDNDNDDDDDTFTCGYQVKFASLPACAFHTLTHPHRAHEDS